MIFLSLFVTFFQIGLFGFGGGYGMLSLIQREVVFNHRWMTSGEFTDIVAISQMTPGQNAGAGKPLCILGSCTATFAVVLPSLLLMILISRYLMKFKDHPAVQHVFEGLRPAVVGLLAAATLMLLTKENFGSAFENIPEFAISVGLFVLTFVCTKFFRVGPIKMILVSALIGLLVYGL